MPRFYPLPSVWRNVQMNEERIVGDAAWHNLVLTGPNRRVCTPCPNTPTPACRFTSGQIGHSRTQIRKYGQYPAEHENRLAPRIFPN
jgi:hypothetical protein